MDDLKIACTIINCFFNRKLSNVEDSKEIAEEMKKKVDEKNELEKYLKKPSKKLFEKIDSVELTDFPKLSVEFIRKKITFGWYQINQALSYLAEQFDKNGDIEIRIEKSICDKTDFKIISSNFYSRHSNNIEYFTVLKYIPDEMITKWICLRLSGTRTCGCCSHIASLINYLSYARFLSEPLRKPGASLNHVLLTLKKDEFSEDEEIDDESTLTAVIYTISYDVSDSIEDSNILSQIVDLTYNNKTKIKRTLSVNDQLNSSIKKKSSTAYKSHSTVINEKNMSNETQQSQVIKSSQLKDTYLSSFENKISFREFTYHIPEWGGVIDANETDFESRSEFSKFSDYRNLVYNNTCTIDYFLLGCGQFLKYRKKLH